MVATTWFLAGMSVGIGIGAGITHLAWWAARKERNKH